MSDDLERHLSANALGLRPSAIRAFATLTANSDVISFAGGQPNPETFPSHRLAVHAREAIIQQRAVSLQYGPTAGLPRLRELIIMINRTRGIQSTLEEVLVTTGSQQALMLIAQVLLDPGDVVLVELPTYVGAISAFNAQRAVLVGVEQDDDGCVPEALEGAARELARDGRRIKLFYTIPNFQNPSGRLMTQARREAVREIARRHGFFVVEDDPYGELVYVEDLDTTPMCATDRGHVVYLGSFSKVLAPGLRCGWVTAPRELARKLELAKEAADLCSGMLDQAIVAEFCAGGALSGQIARVREFYRSKRDVLRTELARYFGGSARWTAADGGLFTFLTLNDERDTALLVPRAIEEGVAFVPGGPFFVDGSGSNSMRLTFAKEPEFRIREGVARLHKLLFGTHASESIPAPSATPR